MSLKKPIAEISTGLFCFSPVNNFKTKSTKTKMPDYFDNIHFDAESFAALKSEGSFEFVECHFNGVDFDRHNLGRMKFLDCHMSECNLSNQSAKSSTFRDVSFTKSKLIGMNWSEASTFSSIAFSECILDYSVFHSMNLKGIKFSACRMCEVDFYESELINADFSDCLLKGATFNKASLHGADFRGAREYYIDVRQTNVKKAKFSLPEALSLLSSLEIIVE